MHSKPPPEGRRALVVIGGEPLHPGVPARCDRADVVIAADSGFDHALAAGLRPDRLLGDLDSITPAGLERARADGVEIVAYPTDKDATDTELALDAALDAVGPGGSITLLSGGGDRFDHLLASLHVLAMGRFAGCAALAAWFGPALVEILHAPRSVDVPATLAGVTVSLVPLTDVHGVTTVGLAWPLTDEPLPLGTSRGVSNLTVGGPCTVAASRGVLAVVVPHATELDDPETHS